METRAYSRLQMFGLVGGVLISAMILSGCGGGKEPQPSPKSSGGEQTRHSSESLPDLVISAIEVFPVQPQANQTFTVNVYVRNAGQAPSGNYDLAMFIKDVSHGYTYPIGTFRQERLQPGENIAAHSATQRVSYPGSHQVHVEINPFLFKDGNDHNNTTIRAFNVY